MEQELKNLSIADNFELPYKFITKRCNILAKQNGGKSYTGAVFAEEMDKFINEYMKIDVARLIIIDPNRVYYGLRTKYPIHIIGGTHADIKLDLDRPRKMAQMVHKFNLSVIVDLKDERREAMQQFVADFLDELYFLSRNIPTHIIIDEADIFAPQNKFGNGAASNSFQAVDSIVRRARSDGMGCTLISQRPQAIDKSVLGQADINIFLNIVEENALKKVRELLGSTGANKDSIKKYIEQITHFDQGEALLVSPSWLKIKPKVIKIRKRFSFDAGKTREFGEEREEPELIKLKSNQLISFLKEEKKNTEKAEDPGVIKNGWTGSDNVPEEKEIESDDGIELFNLKPVYLVVIAVICSAIFFKFLT